MDEYLDKPSDSIIDKTRKVQDDYIYDFMFDDGHIQNIYLVDKRNIAQNKVQVINQFEQTGTQANRYDVTILVNGLPIVQMELKKHGVSEIPARKYLLKLYIGDRFIPATANVPETMTEVPSSSRRKPFFLTEP